MPMEETVPGIGRPIFEMLQPLVLASASPRRKELLASVGLRFEVVPSNSEEEGDFAAAPVQLVTGWAGEKAEVVAAKRPESWVLAADTIVVLEGEVFGKPRDPHQAAAMLRRLSGREHEVISGMCLIHRRRGFKEIDHVLTAVRFKELLPREIDAYVRTGEPMDKAGGYGIQGTGGFLVQAVNGSYTNVVGLPLCETVAWLLRHRVITPVVG